MWKLYHLTGRGTEKGGKKKTTLGSNGHDQISPVWLTEDVASAPISLKLPKQVVEDSARARFCVLGK